MGSIEVGKLANFIVLNHSDWRHLIYEMVDPPIESVIVRGKVVA
jgi:imidazolonepropionase